MNWTSYWHSCWSRQVAKHVLTSTRSSLRDNHWLEVICQNTQLRARIFSSSNFTYQDYRLHLKSCQIKQGIFCRLCRTHFVTTLWIKLYIQHRLHERIKFCRPPFWVIRWFPGFYYSYLFVWRSIHFNAPFAWLNFFNQLYKKKFKSSLATCVAQSFILNLGFSSVNWDLVERKTFCHVMKHILRWIALSFELN